jgi:2-desacetyl-2-hydroxyethyl bacteriochlorophyllide A dehydrogenase
VKAVVIERPHEIVFRDVEAPACGPADVLIRSRKAGVCRTDLELLEGELGDRWVTYPCIPGHEWSGTVAEVGRNVTEFQAGDRVVSEGMIPCNRCRRCRNGETNLCENYDQLGFTRAGGYGEFVLAPRHTVHRLPDHVSFESGVLIEPASCVLRALERTAPQPGDAIGVIGIGTLGSIAVQLARLFAPRRIVAYGIRAEELAFAERLGADHVVNVAETDAEEETAHLLGEGLDVVIETAGAVPAVELATRLARLGGRVGLLGIAGQDRTLELPADRIAMSDLRVIGTVSYTSAVWSRMMRLVENRLVDLDPIVTHRFPVADFQDAFALMDQREGTVVKILLEHAAS